MNAPFNLFTRHTEAAQSLPMLYSNNLFALGREIRIMHAGEEYRLRLTRNNRLILRKKQEKTYEKLFKENNNNHRIVCKVRYDDECGNKHN